MRDLDHVLTQLGGMLSEDERESLRNSMNKGGGCAMSLADIPTARNDVVLLESTRGCCGVDLPTCSCAQARNPPQLIISSMEPSSVMLFGRIEYRTRHSRQDWNGLHLNDGQTSIPVIFIRPDPAWLNNIVSITAWKYIACRPTPYLEVPTVDCAFKSNEVLPRGTTWHDVLKLYPIQDAPVFAGRFPLCQALQYPERCQRAKAKYFLVVGRVASVSPLSGDDRNAHFFVEIETFDSTNRQSIPIILAGHAIQFHPFLQPGTSVLMTDLTKVFAKECNMYMLTTTTSDKSNTTVHHLTEAECAALTSSRFFPTIPVTAAPLTISPNDGTSSMLNYKGRLTRWICDDSFELDHNVTVVFAHFPLAHRCAGMRVGASVTLHNVHLLAANVVGLCCRSSVVIDAFAETPSPTHDQPLASRVKELSFHQLSLPIVHYLLTLSRDIVRRFTTPSNVQKPSEAWHVFGGNRDKKWRKRTLLREIAELAGIFWQARPTLGRIFLLHTSSNCFSAPIGVRLPGRAISLQELAHYYTSSNDENDAVPSSTTEFQAIYSSNDQTIPSPLVLGCLAGSLASHDLRLVDRSGSIPLQVIPNDDIIPPDGLRPAALYHVLAYDVVLTKIPNHEGLQTFPGAHVSSTFIQYVHLRCRLCDLRPIGIAENLDLSSANQDVRRFLVLRIEMHQPSYRIVHAVELPMDDENSNQNSAFSMVEILVPTHVVPWYATARSIWEVKNAVLDKNVQFVPPVQAPYKFHYALEKLKAMDNPFELCEWKDLTQLSSEAKPLTLLRYLIDSTDTIEVIASIDVPILRTTSAPISDDRRHLYKCIADAFDDLQTPRDLHVIPLMTSKRGSCYLADYSPPNDVHEEQLVSVAGIVTGLRCSKGHKSFKKRRGPNDPLALFLNLTLQNLTTKDEIVVEFDATSPLVSNGLTIGLYIFIHRVKKIVRKQTFKTHLVQCHATHVQALMWPTGQRTMNQPQAHMIDMYQYETIDRRIYRFLATVCHVSYVILKVRCRHCHSVLMRENGALRHMEYSLCPYSPTAIVACALRCIIDDGTAQVELHCENEVAWSLLQVPNRSEFETAVVQQGNELTFFASNEVVDPLAIRWRDAVWEAVRRLSQLSIHARRFYSDLKASQPGMSLLRCDDFSVRTPVQSMVHMEGIEVEVVHAKSEVRRLMAMLSMKI
ncbi:hypothetical protein LEN26_011102 [Aphanomyces euteiches]|nr:hypothetical protein LEN26_011102 [Aphanomyces euteiches]